MQKRLVMAAVAAIGITTLALPSASWAEQTAPETSQNAVSDFKEEENSNPFSPSNDSGGMGILDLIRRATSSGNPVFDAAQQRQEIDDATANFFKKREQLMQQGQPQQVQPEVPELKPSN